MDDFRGQCFVMQPFDHAMYDSLYEQVFQPAIVEAKLRPYRVDTDPKASILIDTVEEEITKSIACFGEISEDNPNVWFELGYAIAAKKPLCMVCSDARGKFPFDVQHRKIIRYPAHALPKDYEKLKREITDRLVALVEKEESRLQNTETASALAVVPETEGLAPHELLALTLVFEDQYTNGTAPWNLAESMTKSGFIKSAANLAASGLIRKKFIEINEVSDQEGYPVRAFFVTEYGIDWLLANQKKLNLRIHTRPESTAFTIDKGDAAEIKDEDIPF